MSAEALSAEAVNAAAEPLDLSVVVPFYEEEATIPTFFAEILAVLDRLGLRSEVSPSTTGPRTAPSRRSPPPARPTAASR